MNLSALFIFSRYSEYKLAWATSLFFISLTFAIPATAQLKEDNAGFAIETNIIAGRILKHTAKLKADIPPLSTAFDVNFVQQTYGKKDWHQRRHYPLVGFGITYTNYGNNKVFGQAVGLYPNLQIPIIRGENLEWTFRLGFGGCYITKHYDRAPTWDTLNTLIGSHLNNFSIFMTDLRYHANKHVDIQAGLTFTHISNAAFKQPNLGINMYGAHVGIRYYPSTSNPEKIYDEGLPQLKNRWLFQARAGISYNEAGYTNGPIYPVYLLSGYVSRRWLSKNKLFIGIDYSYHEKVRAFLKNNEIYPGEEASHSYKSAVFIGNEFLYGRVGILMQVGYYLREAYLTFDPYYEKLGANLYIVQKEQGFVKELSVCALLKTHLSVAELVEFGVGFGF